jgi:mycothiol synthase
MEKRMEINTVLTQLNMPELAVPEISFRLFRGDADFPGMVATINAAKLADQVERADTVEDVRKNYQYLKNSDPHRDVLIAVSGQEIIAYSRVDWYLDERLGYRIYRLFGFIRPEWRHKGIGRAMLRYNEAALRNTAAGHLHAMPAYFESFGYDTEKENDTLLKSEGYAIIRNSYQMVRPDLENIPDLALPEGLEVRLIRPEDYRTVWLATQEAFRDHWGYTQGTEEDYQSWIHHRNFQPELWQVAWEGSRVAGTVLNFIDQEENREYQRRRGWTEDISTGRPWRKRGLAHALIARSLRILKEQGMKEAALGVDTENLSGALHLYESMGYRPVKRMSIYRKLMN